MKRSPRPTCRSPFGTPKFGSVRSKRASTSYRARCTEKSVPSRSSNALDCFQASSERSPANMFSSLRVFESDTPSASADCDRALS